MRARARARRMRVRLECVTMLGNEYALWRRDGRLLFPHGELRDGEAPADAVRRVVEEWTGTRAPKVELADLLAHDGGLLLLFRAVLTEDPKGEPPQRFKRMELPEDAGALGGRRVEDALKTSLSYKLTRA